MSAVGILALSATFLLQNGVSMQTGAINQKSESRDCSVNVAGVAGNVTVENCPGIPAKAIEGLNRELKARRLSENQARREAEDWRQKYEGLQASLASAGLSKALMQKASSYLDQGDLTQASKTLDEALRQADADVAEAASAHYFRAKVAELAFDSKTTGQQLEVAHTLAPHAIIIATDYGNFLTDHGRPSEAESVFKALIDDAAQTKAVDLQAASLINAASSLKFQGKLAEAKEDMLEAAPLWDVCSMQHKPNALNNEAVALAGAANIALLQQHLEEAKELIGKAVEVAKRNLKQEDDVPPAQQDRLNLAGFLLSAAEVYTATGDLDSAVSYSEEASENANQVTGPDLANSCKSFTGRSKIAESLIAARRMNPALAKEYCDDAVAILDPIKDAEGGKFKGYLAQAVFVRGQVLEDMREWGEALTNFKRSEALDSELVDSGESQFRVEQARASFFAVGAAFNSGDQDDAAEYARKAVSLMDGLPSEFDDLHALVLTECAEVLDSLGNHAEAAEIVQKRDKVLSPR